MYRARRVPAVRVLIAAGVLVSGVRVDGHHNYFTRYAMNETVTIAGPVADVILRNPHSFVRVDAPDQDGHQQTWVVEWHSAALLMREGVTRDTLKAGDRVVVVANPGRKLEEHALYMQSIKRPADGWSWGES